MDGLSCPASVVRLCPPGKLLEETAKLILPILLLDRHGRFNTWRKTFSWDLTLQAFYSALLAVDLLNSLGAKPCQRNDVLF
jgi:hypothetical protein